MATSGADLHVQVLSRKNVTEQVRGAAKGRRSGGGYRGGLLEGLWRSSPSLSQLVLSNRIPAVNVEPQATSS